MNEVVSQTGNSDAPIWAKDHEYDTTLVAQESDKTSLGNTRQRTDPKDLSAFTAFDTQQRARSFPRVSVVLNRGDMCAPAAPELNGDAPIQSQLKSELLEKYLIQEISAISSQGKSILNKIGILMNNKTGEEEEVENQVIKFEKERVLSEYFKFLSKHSDVEQMKNVRSIIVLIDKDNLVSLIEDDNATVDPQPKFFKSGSYDDKLKRSQRLTEELNEKFRLTKLHQKPSKKPSFQDRRRLASTMKPKNVSSSTTNVWRKNREKLRLSTTEMRVNPDVFKEPCKSRPKIVYKITHKPVDEQGKSLTSLLPKLEAKRQDLGQGEVYEDGFTTDIYRTVIPQCPPPPPIPTSLSLEDKGPKIALKVKTPLQNFTANTPEITQETVSTKTGSSKGAPSTEKGCCLSDQDTDEVSQTKNTMESNVRSLKKLFESINVDNTSRSSKDQNSIDPKRNWSERKSLGSSQKKEEEDSVMRMIHNLLKTEISNAKAVSKDEDQTVSSTTEVFSCTPVCLGIKKTVDQKKPAEPEIVKEPVEANSKPATVTKATQKTRRPPRNKASKIVPTGSFISGTYMGPFNELKKNKITNLCPKNGVIQKIVEIQEQNSGKTVEVWEGEKQDGMRKCSDFFSSMESLSLRDKEYILNHDQPPKSKSVLSCGGRVRKRAKKKASVARAVKDKIRAIEEGIKRVLHPDRHKAQADLKKKTENQEAVLKMLANEEEIQDILDSMKTDKNKLSVPLKELQLEKIPLDGPPMPKSNDHSRCKAILWAFYAHHLKTIYHAVQNNKLEDPESVKSAQYITMYLKRSNKVKQLALLHLWSRIVRNSKGADPGN